MSFATSTDLLLEQSLCVRQELQTTRRIRRDKQALKARAATSLPASKLPTPQITRGEGLRQASEENSRPAQGESQEGTDVVKEPPVNSRELVTLASVEGRNGRHAEARQLYQMAVARSPTDHVPLKAWGMMEARIGRKQQARALFSKAVELDARDSRLLTAWASLERTSNNWARSEELLEQALEADPCNPVALQDLALCIEQRGDTRTARKILSNGLEAHPTQPRLYRGLAKLEMRCGRVPEAMRVFQRGYLNCRDGHLLGEYAHALARQNKSKKARAVYEEALDADRSNVVALRGLAELESRAGSNPTRALALYEQALELQPGNKYVQHSLAICHIKAGSLETAKRILQNLARVDTENAVVLHTLGELERQVGARPAASQLYRKGLQCQNDAKGRALCYEGAALLLEFDLNTESARAMFAEGCSSCPRNARLLREFACFEKRQGDLEEARRLFRRSLEAKPSDSKTVLQWGMLERRRKDWEAARRLFRLGINLAASDPYTYQGWGMMEVEAGCPEAARKVYEEGSAHCPRSMPLLLARAMFEARQGCIATARQLFQSSQLAPDFPPLIEAWATFEESTGNCEAAGKLRERYEHLMAKQTPG